jgi:hypothetical protein
MEERQEYLTQKDLFEQADDLLKRAGYTINGLDRSKSDYKQSSFERRMQTGAYGRNSEKGRK